MAAAAAKAWRPPNLWLTAGLAAATSTSALRRAVDFCASYVAASPPTFTRRPRARRVHQRRRWQRGANAGRAGGLGAGRPSRSQLSGPLKSSAPAPPPPLPALTVAVATAAVAVPGAVPVARWPRLLCPGGCCACGTAASWRRSSTRPSRLRRPIRRRPWRKPRRRPRLSRQRQGTRARWRLVRRLAVRRRSLFSGAGLRKAVAASRGSWPLRATWLSYAALTSAPATIVMMKMSTAMTTTMTTTMMVTM